MLGVSGISGPGRLLQVGNLARLPIFFMGFRLDLAFVGAEVEGPRVAWEDPPQTPQTRRAPDWRICAAARPVRGLRKPSCKPITKEYSELWHGCRPFWRSSLPGSRKVLDSQVYELACSILCREQCARLNDFTDRSIEPFDRVGRIDQSSDLGSKLEEWYNLSPSTSPYLSDGGIALAHLRGLKRL